ncbi:hypothetical protein [Arachidicoccus sp.]|uniref:hypothetical protein n=1 Tax=Arachidicoccus sp. TaxID=1872624 RepID=UPI003D1D785E
MGIEAENIHILIGFNEKRKLRNIFSELIERLQGKAQFFRYPGRRKEKQYPSSIRPHIFKQHLQKFPLLKAKLLFYYDSDIILRELLNFDLLTSADTRFVSDTRSYTDSTCLKKTGGVSLFQKMCKIVGIAPEIVENNDLNCDGVLPEHKITLRICI